MPCFLKVYNSKDSINLMAYKEFSEALEDLGLDINVIEDQDSEHVILC